MAERGMLTKENFWQHVFVKSLNVRGRIALCYVMYAIGDRDQIILEDMASFCGFDLGECEDWLEFFMTQGMLRAEMRWS